MKYGIKLRNQCIMVVYISVYISLKAKIKFNGSKRDLSKFELKYFKNSQRKSIKSDSSDSSNKSKGSCRRSSSGCIKSLSK